jgi:nucleoside-diphosphate-sugar epimerase
MRILVLGGTMFLSRAVAEEAVRRGHDVRCACRGASGSLPDGVAHVPFDRTTGAPPAVEADAVVDVARHPSWVRNAVAAWPDAHWVFVSTISVYADNAVPGQAAETGALLPALDEDRDPMETPETYGSMKVACEDHVRAGAGSASVVRPGLIVGPGDPTGRFTYWPERMADAGPVLAPGSPEDLTQVVDVRDLAAWCVDLAEQRTAGTWDAIGPPTPMATMLEEVARGVGTSPALVWVPSEFLTEHDVEPWAGERGVPLWLPRPEYDGMTAHDHVPAAAAGLVSRPLADVARDTLAWSHATPDAVRTGLSREAEAEVLAAWRARSV